MNLYLESSAIAARLLGESNGEIVSSLLERADNVVSSELLLLECDRALMRAERSGQIVEAEAASKRAVLNREASFWTLLRIDGEVLDRARRSFPIEPVRSLDALHLASLLVAGSIFVQAKLLSFDDRIRANAKELGFELAEATPIDPGHIHNNRLLRLRGSDGNRLAVVVNGAVRVTVRDAGGAEDEQRRQHQEDADHLVVADHDFALGDVEARVGYDPEEDDGDAADD